MPANVRVAIRVRPLLPHEVQKGHTQSILQIDDNENTVSVAQGQDSSQVKSFKFDKIIDQTYT